MNIVPQISLEKEIQTVVLDKSKELIVEYNNEKFIRHRLFCCMMDMSIIAFGLFLNNIKFTMKI